MRTSTPPRTRRKRGPLEKTMSGEEVRTVRKRLGFDTQEHLADALGCSRRTVYKMEADGATEMERLALVGMAYEKFGGTTTRRAFDGLQCRLPLR